jgi:2-(1,2-epoxy-1,2-dihydrophenyl)acetyl-CoA isomerase
MKASSQRLIRTLWELEKPTLAVVHGVAAGLGAHLAFACDLVLASPDARFIEVFVRRGLAVDAGGAFLLPRLIGLQRAKELVFFGEDLDAERAAHWGLVNRIVPAEELDSTARQWATRLAQGPTIALGLSKRLLNRSLESDLDTALEEEAFAQSIVAQSEDMQEGVRSFLERRPPNFRGR